MPRESSRQNLFFATLLCLAGCFAARPGVPLTIPADGIFVEEFGRTSAGDVVERTFVLLNEGSQPLGLELEASSCDCLVSPTTGVITAGQTLAVEMRVDTRTLQGRVEMVAAFATTDPDRRTLQLILAGEVVPPVTVEPPVLYFGQVRSGVAQVREIVIQPSRAGIRIRRVFTDGGGLGLRKVGSVAGTGGLATGLVLEVTLPGNSGPGGFEGRLVVETTDVRIPKYAIPVLAIVLPE
jgi:hypothetical protein